MAEKITVVGYYDPFDLDKIKESVVKIGEKYYMRHDDKRIVWINNEQGKKRAFTITSPRIIRDHQTGTYIMKDNAIRTEDGVWLDKSSKDIVALDGKYYRRSYCAVIDGKTYLLTDPRLATCKLNGSIFLKEKGIKLSPTYYKNYDLVNPKTPVVTTDSGEIIRRDHQYKYFSGVAGKLLTTHSHDPVVRNVELTNVLVDFQDKTNPQEDRLVMFPAATAEVRNQRMFSQFRFFDGGQAYFVHNDLLTYFQEARDKFIMPRRLTKLEAIRKKCVDNFSDMDEKENVTKIFQPIAKPFAGKQNLYTPDNYGVPLTSKSFSKTGGIEFSFGLEFETSNGLIPNELLRRFNILAVGDRSVGAGEYVTSPMQGNAGIDVLEAFCKEALSPHTLVDDRCGLHVHVGTLHSKASKPESYQAPSFNKHFLINAIKLGTLIEEELYSALPPNRTPILYHCHSIKRWKDINVDNFDTYLGAYIFGHKEWWLKPTDQCPHQLFNFVDFRLNADRNRNRELGVWAEGRYKWLNLIHSYTRSKHRTIEFRIFSATTTFEKTYAALLTSMAFTYVLDNHPEIIKEGVTLSHIFKAAFKGYPKLVTFLDDYYAERKAKFNRKKIYVDSSGKSIDLPFLK